MLSAYDIGVPVRNTYFLFHRKLRPMKQKIEYVLVRRKISGLEKQRHSLGTSTKCVQSVPQTSETKIVTEEDGRVK